MILKLVFQNRKKNLCGRRGAGMATRLTLRIQERMARLTPSEAKIAAVLLENHAFLETHTATELAGVAKVSKASAARFFRTLGYSDFEEARNQAREERNRTQPYAYTVSVDDRAVMGRTLGEHLELEVTNLRRSFEEMRPDLLSDTAQLLVDAPRVWFLGFGMEEGPARMGRLMLSKLRPNVTLLGVHQGSWAEDLAMTGPRDALILCTLPPRPRALSALMTYARTTRMNIITICDHAFIPHARRFSRVILPCHVASYGPVPTHATMISMLRLLAISVRGQIGSAASQRSILISDIDEELDLNDP
jgi:DNA-binding MurR/RpiR family transcriptional regulator